MTLRNLQTLFNCGRLRKNGYLSVLPVDHGVEHSAGAWFAPNPDMFDPDNVYSLAIESGCNAVASTLDVMGSVARSYAHKIPFIMKFKPIEFLSYPNTYDQTLFANVRQAFAMGAIAVAATVYSGSAESRRQIRVVSQAFAQDHDLGMACIP